MKILLVGDVFGKGGRKAVRFLLPKIIDQESVDLVIANVENVSGGIGVSRNALNEVKDAGVQVMTSGNHVWKKSGVEELLQNEPFLLRPANYPPNAVGKGAVVWESNLGVKVGILNLLGRIFMEPLDCPFRVGESLAEGFIQEGIRVIVVDFHAEATSEKAAFGFFLDGKVSAVAGSHTHVQTADERIFPKGTGFITDMGMTGPQESVIGIKIESSVKKFVTGVHQRLEPSTKGIALHGVLFDICEKEGICKEVKRIKKVLERNEPG